MVQLHEALQQVAAMDASCSDSSQLWIPEIVERIAAHLSPNAKACLRSSSKLAADLLKHHTVLRLSKPIPNWAFTAEWSKSDSCHSLTRKQRELLVALVAASDDVANLDVALAAAEVPPRQEYLEIAARAGAMATCRALSQRQPLQPLIHWPAVLQAAAEGGQSTICDWCLGFCSPPHRAEAAAGAMEAAARCGHAALAERLLDSATTPTTAPTATTISTTPTTTSTAATTAPSTPPDHDHHTDRSRGRCAYALAAAAIQGCDLATVQRLWAAAQDLLGRAYHDGLLRYALASPLPDWRPRAEWLVANGASLRGPALGAAAVWSGGGSVERLSWLRSQGWRPGPGDDGALLQAIRKGDVAALEWLWAAGVRSGLDPDQISREIALAAKAGHLEVLEALQRLGFDLDLECLAVMAASGGQLAVLQWIHEWGCRKLRWPQQRLLTSALFSAAASSGSVECVRWLAAAGCGMGEGAWEAAVRSGCVAAVEALAELGCPRPTDGEPLMRAASLGEWRILRTLLRLGLGLGPGPGARARPSEMSQLFASAVAQAPLSTLTLLADEFRVDEQYGRIWVEAEEAARRRPGSEGAEVLAWVWARGRGRQQAREGARRREG